VKQESAEDDKALLMLLADIAMQDIFAVNFSICMRPLSVTARRIASQEHSVHTSKILKNTLSLGSSKCTVALTFEILFLELCQMQALLTYPNTNTHKHTHTHTHTHTQTHTHKHTHTHTQVEVSVTYPNRLVYTVRGGFGQDKIDTQLFKLTGEALNSMRRVDHMHDDRSLLP